MKNLLLGVRHSLQSTVWSLLAFSSLTLMNMTAAYAVEKSWLLFGLDLENSSNASKISKVKKSNINNLELKWIYNIPIVPLGTPLNPINNPRGENSTALAVSVDKHGVVYATTNDGRILVLDSYQMAGTNPDGSQTPQLLNTFDLFYDPQYSDIGFDNFISRAHPTVVGDAIYAANYKYFRATTSLGTFLAPVYADRATGTTSPTNLNYFSPGAVLYKIDRNTGQLLWKTVIDDNQQSMVSLIGVTPIDRKKDDNLIIIGITSGLSGTLGSYPAVVANDPFAGTCCNSRGGLAAVRESDGKLIWKTYTTPTPTAEQNAPNSLEIAVQHGSVDGWFGASIWSGGNFPVSTKYQLVYAGTGEAFSSYDAASACESNRSPLEDNTKCLSVLRDGSVSNASFADTVVEQSSPMVRSPVLPVPSGIIAYDYNTGKIKWAHALEGFDVWNAACISPSPIFGNLVPFCPIYLRNNLGIQYSQKDRDAAVPMLIEGVKINGHKRDIILGMTKGTTLAAFDAETGEELWMRRNAFGLGGLSGDGFIFGKATDGKRFYANTGQSSTLTLGQYQDPTNPAKVVAGSCDLPGGPGAGFGTGNGDPNGLWGGGMYVAVNLHDGSTAWQRCAIAKAINPVTRLPNGIANPARSTSALSYANGIVYAPGASSRIPLTSQLLEDITAEMLLLDADTGALLKTLSFSLPGEPESTAPNYQRAVLVGDRIYLTGGTKRYNGVINPTQIYNRILMYQLKDDDEDED